jgi:glycosyltransferase involved in cell wall biosynthesis
MKIGIDIRPLMDKNYSGVSWYTLNLVRAILEADKENEYILFYNSFFNMDDRIPDLNFANCRIVRYKYPNKLLNFSFRFFNCPKIDKRLDVEKFLMFNINFIGLSAKCSGLLTIHDLSFLKFPEFFTIKRRLWHWFINVAGLAKKFTTIIAVSENTKQDIVDLLKIDPSKIKAVYSGINHNLHKINLASSVADLILSNDDKKNNSILPDIKSVIKVIHKYDLPKKFILFLGTLEPRKNIIGLVKAYDLFRTQKNSDYKLVIAGARGWKSKEIFTEINNSSYNKDILVLDYVGEEDKNILYNLATCFVFPSFYEGFGFPALEASVCGTKVVASHSSSLPEVSNVSTIFINPYEIKELALAIALSINQKKSESQQNVILLKEKFNWRKTAEAYIDILKN